MKNHYLALISFLLLCVSASAQTITGTITDKNSKEPMVGAIVVVKGTSTGTSTDIDGKFSLEVKTPPPYTITVSLLGYESQDINITSDNVSKPIKVSLGQNVVQMKSVEIVESRITEKQQQSPLTVESMGITAIKETPAANFYEGLGLMKGVDVSTASIGFVVINTRGFNSTSPVRSLQLIDGVDNQSPGLNFALGNFLGASELDVNKVDLIVGASTAYYGPNAFNGVIDMTTKDPFIHQGISVSLKGGERNLFEGAIRYAQAFKNKKGRDVFAFKLNVYYMRANDWPANNTDQVTGTSEPKTNPGGYDAVNRYGDEQTNNYFRDLGMGVIHRTGYNESDLVDYHTNNVKANLALHFKLTDSIQMILAGNFGTGNTVYQGDNRYDLKNILFFQSHFEIKQDDRFFFRLYSTNEDAGNSYDAVFTALQLQNAVKSDGSWFQDYETYWQSKINPKILALGYPVQQYHKPFNQAKADSVLALPATQDSISKWSQQARAVADTANTLLFTKSRLVPGSAAFDSVLNSIISKKTYKQGGTMFFDRSALYHAQAEYKFKPKFMDIILGGSFRLYVPNSQGTIFSDTTHSIVTYNFGFYLGLEKKFFHDQFKVNLTCRLDKDKNFPVLASPAASLVYSPVKEHTIRLSFSAAIRNPTLQDQYLFYNVGRAILIGNLHGFDSLVTIPSLLNYYKPEVPTLDSLKYFNVAPVRPEEVKTIELGYRATLFKRVYLDASYYFSFYNNFIGYQLGAVVPINSDGSVNSAGIQAYRVAANAKSLVTTQGVSIGINYFFWKWLAFNGNYSWNVLNKHGTDDPLIPAFNTPENKFNVGFSGRDIEFKKGNAALSHWGFCINYKWVQGFNYEGSPQFTGYVPAYGLLDVQINKEVPKIFCTFKLGASNLLNNYHYEVYGGPRIGRLAYFSILFEVDKLEKLKKKK